MMVYTKTPRARTFTRFYTATDMIAWCQKNKHRIINARPGLLGSYVVNHFVR